MSLFYIRKKNIWGKKLSSPQLGHGDFYLMKKGSLHLSGIRFCDFSYIIYLYTHKKWGLIQLF